MAGRWATSCMSLLPSPTPGLVDGSGNSVSQFDNNTWGVDIETCERYCNHTTIPLDFNFPGFANAFTNFLLPWLALTAQLPFETGDPWSDFMSVCLALGSPALIAYSLTVTILNRLWVRTRFNDLHSRAKGQHIRNRYPELSTRVHKVQFLLQEAQQSPMRASQEDGWLSSLIVGGHNQEWWERLEVNLKKTRRGVTFSFVAQISAAILAWLLTIISSFVGSLGDIPTSLQVSGGSLWVWMVPILIGWIVVGTQSTPKSIEESLREDIAYRALEPPIQQTHWTEDGEQFGVRAKSGLTPQPHRVQTVAGGFQAPPKNHLNLPVVLLSDIGGDEGRNGPIYNYARVYTWWQFAHNVEEALSKTLENVEANKGCRRQYRRPVGNQRLGPQLRPWDTKKRFEDNLEGDSLETASYCGLETRPILAYPALEEIPSELKKRILAASFVALFLQWGTTGPSIMIAYLTPTIGLGCRSGGYLAYGCMGTFVWLCLLLSMQLSHRAMLVYQEVHLHNPSIDLRKNVSNPPSQHKRSRWHTVLCISAVVTRWLGKTVAFANALWLVISSLMEMIGAYDNCWCKGDVLGLKDKGWVVLFKSIDDLAMVAKLPLGMGVATSITACGITFLFFYFCCRNPENN